MNDNLPAIKGYRIGTEAPKPDRQLKIDYLMLTDHAAHALRDLRKSVRDNGAKCLNRPEDFSDSLPTDGEAEVLCAGCPSFAACDIYRIVAKPSFGVHAGKVSGRSLEDLDE